MKQKCEKRTRDSFIWGGLDVVRESQPIVPPRSHASILRATVGLQRKLTYHAYTVEQLIITSGPGTQPVRTFRTLISFQRSTKCCTKSSTDGPQIDR